MLQARETGCESNLAPNAAIGPDGIFDDSLAATALGNTEIGAGVTIFGCNSRGMEGAELTAVDTAFVSEPGSYWYNFFHPSTETTPRNGPEQPRFRRRV